LPKLTDHRIREIDNLSEKRAESLQALDDVVEGVVNKLRRVGAMENTYVFFTSDNGIFRGEHRVPTEKWRPYEEDIRVPLLVRGPGVAAGSTTYKLALNTDYLPTFTELACSSASPCDTHNWSYVPDGRSLGPVLHSGVTGWRSAALLEAAAHYSPAYKGIRTVYTDASPKWKYVEYRDGARELYGLEADPYERTNIYRSASPPSALAARLQELRGCAGKVCRMAENGP
jgi:arylsulfatase A-like enzyme